jgi:O-antigen/teichoic acid export membrane protein
MSLVWQAIMGLARFQALGRYRTILRDYVLNGFLWSLLASLFNQGSTVISSLLLARILGLEDFGHYAIGLTIVMTAATIAQGGAGLVAAKFIAEFRGAQSNRIGGVLRLCRFLTLGTGLCGAALVLLSARSLAASIYGSDSLILPLKIAAVAVFFQTGVAYLQGSLQGFGAFRSLSHVGLVAGLAHIVATCCGALWGGLAGATAGLAVASMCRYAVFSWALSRVVRGHRIAGEESLTSHDWQLVWRFALPAGLSGFITVPAQSIVMAILARLPGGAELVGLYAAANQIRLMALQMPTLLNSVTMSVLNNLKGKAQHGEFRKLYATNVVATLIAAVLVLIPLALFLPQMLAAYGESFEWQGWYAHVLLLSALPEVFSGALYQMVQAVERMWQSLFWIAIPRDVSFVALSFLWSLTDPLMGVAVAYLSAQLISVSATWVIARKPIREAIFEGSH